jgi:hypothetical protein
MSGGGFFYPLATRWHSGWSDGLKNSAALLIAAPDDAKSIEDADSKHQQAQFNSLNRCRFRQKACYQFK